MQGSGAFDGKRMRQAIQRKTVDYFSSVIHHIERRKSLARPKFIQPDPNFVIDMLPTSQYLFNSSVSIATNNVHSAMNKQKCPVNRVTWTPDGRRLITGSSSGEFTLWNGLTFNFETILQAHDKSIRAMTWSHNDTFMISADDMGVIKYWESSMNNIKAFQGHRDPVRDLTFAPSDNKFASCSDDGTVKIWNFLDGKEERVLSGHGWDVKCIDWHPTKSLLASGSKDNLVKLWCPKTGNHGHKNTILSIKWNKNGNYLLTGARDQLIRVFDIRAMKEVESFQGHKRDVTALAWHPVHETSFVSGGWDGCVYFWEMGSRVSTGGIPEAHDSAVWSLDWHPLGHILATGSNDYTCRFWTRNRPGDTMKSRFDMSKDEAEAMGISTNVEQEVQGQGGQGGQRSMIPGMGGGVPGLNSMSFDDGRGKQQQGQNGGQGGRGQMTHQGGNFQQQPHSFQNQNQSQNGGFQRRDDGQNGERGSRRRDGMRMDDRAPQRMEDRSFPRRDEGRMDDRGSQRRDDGYNNRPSGMSQDNDRFDNNTQNRYGQHQQQGQRTNDNNGQSRQSTSYPPPQSYTQR